VVPCGHEPADSVLRAGTLHLPRIAYLARRGHRRPVARFARVFSWVNVFITKSAVMGAPALRRYGYHGRQAGRRADVVDSDEPLGLCWPGAVGASRSGAATSVTTDLTGPRDELITVDSA